MSVDFALNVGWGILLALAFAGWLRGRSPRRQLRTLATGLAILPLCYVVFALVGGQFESLWHEGVGVLVYGALAALGARRTGWLVVGWLAHIAWDLLMSEAHSAYVPAFYAPLCLGFDGVIALVAWRLQGRLSGAVAPAVPGTR
jgi:hypothetical protein